MDSLLKQLRGKSSGLGREGQKSSQKEVSSKREKNKSLFQKQFTDQMDNTDDSDSNFAAAVAAAAFAIVTLEEEQSLNQGNSHEGSGGSLTRFKSKKLEGSLKPSDSSKITRWLSGKDAKNGKPVGEISTRKPSMRNKSFVQSSVNDTKKPEKVPSIKKTPTFSGKYPNDTGSKRFETAKEKKAGQSSSMSMNPMGEARREENKSQAGKVESKADAWEKAQMEKIRKRYEKVNTTITEWENEHKFKAKSRFDRKERALEERRAIALQEYRNEIARIDKISGEARALAVEKKRNGKAKTIATAKEIRSTGRIPHAFFCF